jgi:acyl-coenzyme A synthetase/AMP-(fatty) acid ligase
MPDRPAEHWWPEGLHDQPALTDCFRSANYRELESAVGALQPIVDAVNTRGRAVAVLMTPSIESATALLAVLARHASGLLLADRMSPHMWRDALRWTDAPLLLAPAGVEHFVRSELADSWVVQERVEGIAVLRCTGRTPTPTATIPDGSLLQFTSGSTGASRLAVRARDAVERESRVLCDRIGMSADDLVLCASSPAHSYGLLGGLLAPLSVGAHTQLLRSLTDVPASTTCHPSIVFGLWPAYQQLLARAYTGVFDHTRLLFTAGSPPPHGLPELVQSWCGGILRQDYGTTEVGTIILDIPDTEGSGNTIPVDVSVAPCALHGEDEILVHVPEALWYLDDDGLTTALDEHGWFHTRDAGAFDAEGKLSLDRRLRAPLSIGAGVVAPEVLEGIVGEIEGVRECVVYLGPDGPTLLVAACGIGRQPIIDALHGNDLAIPDRIQFVEALPRSPAGKIIPLYR